MNRPRMDDEAAAAAMKDYLIQLGHTDIAFVKGRARTSTTGQRLKGYERALRNSGLCRRSDFIVDGDYTFKSGLHDREVASRETKVEYQLIVRDSTSSLEQS
ncbi:MAG: hypothetical protein VXY63_00550 [Pseudomonadota bacterium]|nr:hypothetical protein [Pseudomonadota bacterium]